MEIADVLVKHTSEIKMENFKQFKDTKYAVGDHGTIVSGHSDTMHTMIPHLVKGYHAIELVYDGTRHFHKVHRLVATMFVPNPDNLDTVNHKDFNRLNNIHTNLEWMTLPDNVKDAWEKGRMQTGSDRSSAKLDEDAVEQIKLLFVENTLDNQQIGDIFEVSRATIAQIRRLGAWTHVRPDLQFSLESPKGPGGTKKLCGEDIPIIRRMYAEGHTLRKIGKVFSVNYGTINGIISGRNWKNY